MEIDILPMTPEDTFRFDCSPEVACFNACCRDLSQPLTPYDILKLKNNLGLSSDRFLDAYTHRHIGPETGLPVITLKPVETDNRKCPFVRPQGCSVYPDRPASCRLYPLARGISRNRSTGAVSEHFALLREPHCRGFCHRNRTHTVRQWMLDQKLGLFNAFNDMFLEIISLKNRLNPAPLDLASTQLFHRSLYDIDAFKRQISSNGFSRKWRVKPAVIDAVLQDELSLLRFAHVFVKTALFNIRDSSASK